MADSRKSWGIWLAYLPVSFILFVLFLKDFTFYAQFPPAYLLLLILAVIIGLNPIRHQYTYYSFIGGVSLVTYVISGLLPEILLSSIATIVLVLGSDMKWDQHYVYPLYLSMITGVSVLSAGSYQLIRSLFVNNQFPGYQIIPIAVYILVHFLSTHALFTFGSKYYLKEERHFFDKHFKFYLFLGIVMTPFIFAMLYMHSGLGTPGLFIISVPYLVVAIGLKYYFRMYNYREILLEVNRYSQELSNSTKVQVVLDSFVQKLAHLFPIEQIAFGERNDSGDVVVKKIYDKNSEFREPKEHIVLHKDSPVVKAMRNKKIMVGLKAKDWQVEPIYEENYHPESIVALPIRIMAEEKGVFMMTHPQQAVYDDFFTSLIEVFYIYVQIILNNAYNFEMLSKSNFTDFLTGLPNFRGFKNYFDQVIDDADFESLSMIILDLDYFKNVNDEHGHEAGNEVLKDIARLLSKCNEQNDFVARYGGEEFVVLLKDAGREKAFEVAEQIRKEIENHTCELTQSIQADGVANVKVTASIGVATYPDNCSNVYDLVRLADDTMYTKSKQGGRNRVSEYKNHVTLSIN